MSALKDIQQTDLTVTIGFSTPQKNGVISELIKIGEDTKYSHTYVKLRLNSIDRIVIYQAENNGLSFMGNDMFSSKNKVIEEFTFRVSEDIKKKVLQFCVDTSGDSYNRIEFCGMAWVRLMKLVFGKNVKNPFSTPQTAMVCSQVCGGVLLLLGEVFDIKILESQGPPWVYDRCMNMYQQGKLNCERLAWSAS